MVERALKPMKKSVRIAERSIFSALYCFTSLLEDRSCLKPYQTNLLRESFDLFAESIDELYPSICIYLRVDPEKCLDRVRKRGRIEEIGKVDLEYLQLLHEKHEAWLNPGRVPADLIGKNMATMGKSKCKVLILDGNKDAEEMRQSFNECFRYLDQEFNYSSVMMELESFENQLRVTLLTENAYMPQRGTLNSIGLDLFSPRSVSLYVGKRELVLLDLRVALPIGTYGRIASRSSLALRGIDIAGGVIDPDYHGNLGVILCNNGPEDYQGCLSK